MRKLNIKDIIAICSGILCVVTCLICMTISLYNIKELDNVNNELHEINNRKYITTREDTIITSETDLITATEATTENITEALTITTTEPEISIEPILVPDNNIMSAGLYEQNYTSLTDMEFAIMCEVVEAETSGADMESRIHVAHVILNRVMSDQFSNDVITVCTSPNQFARRADISQETVDAVNAALATDDTTGGALFFHSGEWTETFCGRTWIFTDNAGHNFY